MYQEKTNMEKAVGTLNIIRELTSQKIKKIASMYGVKVSVLKPLLKGR